MSAISIYSPFTKPQRDWGTINSWLLATIITVTVHGLLSWIPESIPAPQQGGEQWRIISTVQFVSSQEKPPAPEMEKKAPNKPVVAEKKPQEIKAKTPELLLSNTPKPFAEPIKKIEPQAKPAESHVTELAEEPVEKIENEDAAETIDETDSQPQEMVNEIPQKPLDTTQKSNNSTASLVNQRIGKAKGEYLALITDLIRLNTKFPRIAQKRRIQGSVDVSFVVAKDGTVIDLECHGKYTIFSEDACESVKKSLPLPVPEQAPLQLSFVIVYER